MNTIWLVGLVALWGLVLINLLLTLRVVQQMRAVEDARKQDEEMEDLPELPIGSSAPDFRARSLHGGPAQLSDYAGRGVALIFVSPRCGHCRDEMSSLVKLGASAKERVGIEMILVSDKDNTETRSWIDTIREEDKVEVDLPILVSSRASSNLTLTYNPRGLTPYFCYLDKQGTVQARGPLGAGEWASLKREWQDPSTISPFLRSSGRYR